MRRVIGTFKRYRGKGQQRIANLRKYLERFSDAVHYKKFQAQGFPIGSGEVESAHRYIPQKRLTIPGATWHPETSQVGARLQSGKHWRTLCRRILWTSSQAL